MLPQSVIYTISESKYRMNNFSEKEHGGTN